MTGPPFPRPAHTIIVLRVVFSVYRLDSVRRAGGETGQLDCGTKQWISNDMGKEYLHTEINSIKTQDK